MWQHLSGAFGARNQSHSPLCSIFLTPKSLGNMRQTFTTYFFTITKINLLKPFRLQLHAKLHKVGEIFKRVGEIASVSYLLKFESFFEYLLTILRYFSNFVRYLLEGGF